MHYDITTTLLVCVLVHKFKTSGNEAIICPVMSVFVIILLPCISCNASLNFIYYVEGTMNIISLMTFPNIENQGEMNAVFYIMKQLIQQLYVSSADIYVDWMFLSTANCNNTRPTFLHSNLAVIYTNKSFICITFNT